MEERTAACGVMADGVDDVLAVDAEIVEQGVVEIEKGRERDPLGSPGPGFGKPGDKATERMRREGGHRGPLAG